jgi:hypothetical protein
MDEKKIKNIEKIRFQKVDIRKFTKKEKEAFINELRRRKISFRLTQSFIYFDERYLAKVKDLIPTKHR